MPLSHDKVAKYASLMPPHRQEELRKIERRTASAVSAVSIQSSASDLLEEKILAISTEIEYTEIVRAGLKEALEARKIKEEEAQRLLSDVEDYEDSQTREFVTIKRQRKLIEDDIAEDSTTSTEEAYATSMLHRVLGATAKTTKTKFDQSGFRKSVEEYYGAMEMRDGMKFAHCAVLGWVPSSQVKAAHLVPKSLESAEIAHLFGAGAIVLTAPKNALMLHKNLEMALDAARIAIVPIPTPNVPLSRWKLLVTDESMRDEAALVAVNNKVMKWKEFDGYELRFLNNNRPARRYLYFRFIMTYMARQRAGATDWAEQIQKESKGRMWASPGPYLRRSTLKILARQVSHHFLPEELVADTTFTEVSGCPTRSPDEEETIGLALSLQVKDQIKAADKRVEKKDSGFGEDEDEDEDEEETTEEQGKA